MLSVGIWLYVLEHDGDDERVAKHTEQKHDWISDQKEIVRVTVSPGFVRRCSHAEF